MGETLNLDMLKTFFEPESEQCKEKQNKIEQEKKAWWWNKPAPEEYPKLVCNKDIFTGGQFTVQGE